MNQKDSVSAGHSLPHTDSAREFTINGVVAVVPSYNPDEKLSKVVEGLRKIGVEDIVIVNDGSSQDSLRFFHSLPRPGVTLLSHETNRGKGRALKTAFEYILGNMPHCSGVVTVDGDGQHTASDSARVAADAISSQRVTLGTRDFTQLDIPNRSRLGNRFARGIFRLLFGMSISDTQTGLRGFPAKTLPLLTQIEGERFEYETNMLLELHKAGIGITEVPIETLYINDNESSHYRPFTDSMKIFSVIARFMRFSLSSILSSLIDNAVFYALASGLGAILGSMTVTVSFTAARLLSSAFNFAVNRKAVFNDTGNMSGALGRYYLLALAQFLIGNALLNTIVLRLGLQAGTATLVKMLNDIILFMISYNIQRKWVFGR